MKELEQYRERFFYYQPKVIVYHHYQSQKERKKKRNQCQFSENCLSPTSISVHFGNNFILSPNNKLTWNFWVQFRALVFIFKALHDTRPGYLQDCYPSWFLCIPPVLAEWANSWVHSVKQCHQQGTSLEAFLSWHLPYGTASFQGYQQPWLLAFCKAMKPWLGINLMEQWGRQMQMVWKEISMGALSCCFFSTDWTLFYSFAVQNFTNLIAI